MNERGKETNNNNKKSSTVTTVQVTPDQISWVGFSAVSEEGPAMGSVLLGPDYDVFMLLGFKEVFSL